MPTTASRRPCCFCRKWFCPDRRVGARQRACSAEECQRKSRARTQAAWRAANPDYAGRQQMQKRAEQPRTPEPLAVPTPLDRLPWEVAQDEFGVQGADFIGKLGRLLVQHTKDQMKPQVADSS